MLASSGEEFVYLCFEGSKMVLEGSGRLLAAVKLLECLSDVRSDMVMLLLEAGYLGKVGILQVVLCLPVLFRRHDVKCSELCLQSTTALWCLSLT